MIARVSLEIALRKEFDYSIPAELVRQVDVGSRVQVPFGSRKVLGVVTAVAEESGQVQLVVRDQGRHANPALRAGDRNAVDIGMGDSWKCTNRCRNL